MPEPTDPATWLAIASDALTARINPFGAELSSLTDAQGRELMTDADPAFWTGRAPILFPVVGAVNGDTIHVDGKDYPMRKHGFARHSRFAVTRHDADRLVLRLNDSAETRREYPFAFVLEIAFAIADATLTVAARIGNPGTADLPASFGFHPAFAWPLPYGAPREAHRIVFDRPEPAPLRQLDAAGLIDPAPRSSPLDGNTLPLADDLFAADALIWGRLESPGVTYGAPTGPQLRIAFPDTPCLGIWTKPGSRFVCIEPWHGIADPRGFVGDFRDKPGVFLVPPGDEFGITMEIALLVRPPAL